MPPPTITWSKVSIPHQKQVDAIPPFGGPIRAADFTEWLHTCIGPLLYSKGIVSHVSGQRAQRAAGRGLIFRPKTH
jgi:hypothetical protein